jgi:hypothetical protein
MSVPCKSINTRDAMLDFLKRHYRDASLVLDYPADHWRRENPKGPPSNAFAYGHSDAKIGFDKPNEYEQAVLRWIAFRVGMRRKFVKRGITVPVPWLNCDNHGSSPVIPKEQWDGSEENEGNVVDEIGWQGVSRWWVDRGVVVREIAERALGLKAEADQMDAVTRAEVARLDALWVQETSGSRTTAEGRS